MHRYEITRKFDEIVAFAEIERFLDAPVKAPRSVQRHALGACAWRSPVAAHPSTHSGQRLEPEILLVDEVLAVGDAAF